MPLLAHLEPGEDFPPSSEALAYPNGLLAAGGRLDSQTLLRAYQRGIFPWYEAPQPVLWWTPDPRSVLVPENLHVSRSLQKTLRRNTFTLSCDTRFADVVRACAAPRTGQRGTWIDAAMLNAYREMHELGHAHSIEVWQDGRMVGGLYGVELGEVFFGESMFCITSDASKVALVALAGHVGTRSHGLIDCQVESEHMNSLGAENISRVDFEQRLQHTENRGKNVQPWQIPRNCAELLYPAGGAGAEA